MVYSYAEMSISLLIWKKWSPGLSPPTAGSLIRSFKFPLVYTICRKASLFFPHVFHNGGKFGNWINEFAWLPLFSLLSLSSFQVNFYITTRWILIKCLALVQILLILPIILRINPLMWLIKSFTICFYVHFRPHNSLLPYSPL